MWRTERAALPGIANPLSSEMSCVAWPRTAQACTSQPPRCKELSLHRRLLSELRLPGLISYRRDKCGGEYNLENRLFLARSSSAMTLVAMCCNVKRMLSNLFQRHVLLIHRRGSELHGISLQPLMSAAERLLHDIRSQLKVRTRLLKTIQPLFFTWVMIIFLTVNRKRAPVLKNNYFLPH